MEHFKQSVMEVDSDFYPELMNSKWFQSIITPRMPYVMFKNIFFTFLEIFIRSWMQIEHLSLQVIPMKIGLEMLLIVRI